MEEFWKSAALILVAVIVALFFKGLDQNFSLFLSVTACCIISVAVISFLVPVLDLLSELESACNLGGNTFSTLLKIGGISLTGEIISLICTDAGNATLSKVMGILTNCVTIWLAIPIISELVELLKRIIGAA